MPTVLPQPQPPSNLSFAGNIQASMKSAILGEHRWMILLSCLSVRLVTQRFFPVFGGLAGSLVVSKFTLELLKNSENLSRERIHHLERKAYQADTNYPKLPLITLLFAIAISTHYRKLAFCMGILLGLRHVLVIDMKEREEQLRLRREELNYDPEGDVQ